MLCAICGVRKARRFCPGVRGNICTLCCGTEREVTVDCPLDCEYLQEAHRHEKLTPADPRNFPNPDIRVTEEFLREHEALLLFLASAVLESAFNTPGAVDHDVREALQAMIRTYRSLESGLYYETRPDNTVAANISHLVQSSLADYRKQETERTGITTIRDADVLRLLVFLERLELDNNNGRKRGRRYLDFLRSFFPQEPGEPTPATSSLIVP
jgi:hypothetical protein